MQVGWSPHPKGLLCAVLCLVAQSCPTLWHPIDHSPPGSSAHGDSPGKNTGVGCHALLQGIFPTQGSNPGLPHCRQILYHLSHQGSPEYWSVTYPFSRESSWPRNWIGVSCITGSFFTSWATREGAVIGHSVSNFHVHANDLGLLKMQILTWNSWGGTWALHFLRSLLQAHRRQLQHI